jgi:quinol-cytochrome oxidoreductase complex cytochrome b subunit/coenzyme F420-reducing hydrogenase delta subunit/Pyruvate/2-oxoacid:ferredoxin oxidoreductase delta subunit
MDKSPTAVGPAPRRRSLPESAADLVEHPFDHAFGQAANPWRHLGSLALFLFWIVAATGVYVYIGFDTRADGAYASVERLTSNAFPLGAFARSLHRYASDALALVTVLHVAREWALGRFVHFRRFSWLSGVIALWLVFASGIGGFWLVWDRLAQYSLVATLEWLDALPVFAGTLVRNAVAPGAVSDRLFSLLIFLHIGLPLALLATMWVHLQRLSYAATRPPRALAWGSLAALTLLCLARPVVSDAAADLGVAPATLRLDWFYLGAHAFADRSSLTILWFVVVGFTLLLLALPLFGRAARARRPAVAVVDLASCNGCARCFADCPYAAVTMQRRTDRKPLPLQAVVDPSLCAGCGICAGACPSSTPFRSMSELVSGIDLPASPMQTLRAALESELQRIARDSNHADARPRVVVIGCVPQNGGPDLSALADDRTATLPLLCAAQLPPSFIEYALRTGADGVLVTGCRDGGCAFRLGNRWTEERVAGARAPRLRASVPAERIRVDWVGRGDAPALTASLQSFRADLIAAGRSRSIASRPPKRSEFTHAGDAAC